MNAEEKLVDSVEPKHLEPGIHDLTNKEYHSSLGVSSSHFEELLKSPLHYKTWLTAEKKTSDEMLIGKAVHALFLDPTTFEKEFVIAPKVDRRTTVGKAEYAEFEKSVNDREILNKEVMEIVNNVTTSLKRQAEESQILTRLFTGIKEKSFYWKDVDTGVLCKVRPDCLTDIGVIADLKTTFDASESAYAAQIGKMRYYIQAAFYIDGVNETIRQTGVNLNIKLIDSFILVPVEREAPHGIGVYALDAQAIGLGRRLYKKMLELYAKCEREGKWEGYELKPKVIELPKWVYFSEKP